MQREHYSVDACADGKEALDFAEVTAYDILKYRVLREKAIAG
ncbi:hypothetical protein [Lactonifactor longoviformis]|uniref:Uncharacterized protein n=1 Tax=Lactonifactor longoviformis DSM 17459 TaxID=1122155 RepID=A0A1M4V0G3_9CLOT|nr:hypothetical protein [Lactonifactor longoviformis]SHE62388.1 hypothetical protein SAMN02745158_01062 [Lactonifactor longoviformis DSM 17459]